MQATKYDVFAASNGASIFSHLGIYRYDSTSLSRFVPSCPNAMLSPLLRRDKYQTNV